MLSEYERVSKLKNVEKRIRETYHKVKDTTQKETSMEISRVSPCQDILYY